MKVSVIGLGHVGSVAAAGLASMGHDVIGIDSDGEKVNAFRQGAVPLYEPELSDLINKTLGQGKLSFFHTSEVSGPLGDVIIITTGTPDREAGAADLGQVRSALEWIKNKQPGGGVVVMKSTVPPGTGARLLETILKKSGFEYISNPEFLREGQAVYDWFHPDRIVIGGSNQGAIQAIEKLFQGTEAPFMITDITSAEMIKYAANAFLATKISFINEIAAVCERLDASIDDVSRGISLDPRIGSSFLRAGVGYGGSCFPKDVRALDHLALANGHNLELLRSVITVNNRQRLLPLQALRKDFGRLYGVSVGILGLAFKPNTDDLREAPSLDLIRILAEEGAIVRAYDPKAAAGAKSALPSAVQIGEDLFSCTRGAEALVLITEWPEIVAADWREIAGHTKPPRFLFDGRNALDSARMRELGFNYHGVGRGAGPSTNPQGTANGEV